MLRWKIANQEYRGNMNIIYKEGKSQTNADGISGWPLENFKSNSAYDPEVASKIPIHFMEIDGGKNSRFSEWAPESGTPNTHLSEPEGTETPIVGCSILLQLLQEKHRSPELESQLEEPWLRDYKDNKVFLIDGLFCHRDKDTSSLTVVDRDYRPLILQECHDCPYMGHMSEDRTKERVTSTDWWPQWKQEFSEYINPCEIFQN
ncbi:hypothetical protein O181_036194 [Austropuccinia psidii MF-1]|uniref:Integrase zinc-binding domain-containing protein n=1 Tax=Austropuccinia psidii MF-1 TaxID=1389203 RepID=A0A9Q3HBA6_9BASI|nr:hypothetical protein [Austropuccinia psidii MF-1]